MSNFDDLFQVTNSSNLELADELKTVLNSELALGMTRWVCRYGTLGDGFDKLTDSQKYYQSLREVYTRSIELKKLKARAKLAYASFLEAQVHLKKAKNEIETLKAESAVEMAETQALELLITAEDTTRQLDEFNKVRLELQDAVRAKYPEGIEQAERDNWLSVAKYRVMNHALMGGSDLKTVPLSFEDKFKIGMDLKRSDMTSPLLVNNEARAYTLMQEIEVDNKKHLEEQERLATAAASSAATIAGGEIKT